MCIRPVVRASASFAVARIDAGRGGSDLEGPGADVRQKSRHQLTIRPHFSRGGSGMFRVCHELHSSDCLMPPRNIACMSRRFTFGMRLFETPFQWISHHNRTPGRASRRDLHEGDGKSDRRFPARSTLAIRGFEQAGGVSSPAHMQVPESVTATYSNLVHSQIWKHPLELYESTDSLRNATEDPSHWRFESPGAHEANTGSAAKLRMPNAARRGHGRGAKQVHLKARTTRQCFRR